ncbi:MAG TPA: GHKL domain-containing protein [Rhodobacteraceae bacterium]|nr:GHKL domain-containing protein [Paracoccaceae bacterium]
MKKDNLEAILELLGVAVIVVNEKQKIISDNALARKQFSRRLMGRRVPEVFDSRKLERKITRVLEGERDLATEIRIGNGNKQTYRVSLVRLEPTVEQDFVRVIASFENITHIRATSKMRSDFVANVSHELRSPLTSLYGFIETLRNNPEIGFEDRDRFLDLMENEAKRMVRLIDELLTLSILQAETDPDPGDEINLVPLLERVIESLAPMARREKTQVTLIHAGPEFVVRGAGDKLTQVFRNLIENAIKYSRSDTEVRITIRADPVEKDMVNILVQDSGDGIDAKHIPRLTERFYRVDKGRSRSMGGTGLGLAIVKHILAQHRGELRIESTVGVGSTFMVNLPVN